jgi:flagellar biosynthetic protein FliR
MAKSAGYPNELLPYIGIIVKEILIGLSLGFVINLISSAVQGAGQLLDYNLGFIMATP